MLSVIQVVALLLVAVTMSMALAHVLEFPGKKRLEKETYLAVQTIYYPGFTIAGFAEPLSIIPTILLLSITPTGSPAFWLTLIAFVSLVVMHAIFWIVTQPVNKFWLKNQHLSKLGNRPPPPIQPYSTEREAKQMWRIGKKCETGGNIPTSCERYFVSLR